MLGENNGKLPLRTCPGCSVSEPYQSPDWALVPATPAQGLNTHYYTIDNITGVLKSSYPDLLPDVLFDGENISFDASLVIYINSTNIPPIMIVNRIYETQNLLLLVSFLVGLRTYQHTCTLGFTAYIYIYICVCVCVCVLLSTEETVKYIFYSPRNPCL
jgi:hypothetical protein